MLSRDFLGRPDKDNILIPEILGLQDRALSENAVILGFTLWENAVNLLRFLSENAVYALKMYIFALLNRQYYVIQENCDTD